MFSISRCLIFTFLIALCDVNCAKITLEQMQQAAEPVRMVCIQKTKVSEDVLANMREGKLEDQKELKCYVNCVLEMMQTVRKRLSVVNNTCSVIYALHNQQMKKGKIQYDAVMKSIDTMMPEELRDDTKRAIEVCKGVSVGIKDHCESSFTLMKCIFKENPNFFFP